MLNPRIHRKLEKSLKQLHCNLNPPVFFSPLLRSLHLSIPPRAMKSYAQTICLKDDPAGIAEYKKYHADSWPEVLQALKAVGILRMKIFLLGEGRGAKVHLVCS